MTWEPEIGDRVRIAGRLNVYGPRGSYSVRAQEMIPAGEGARARAL